MQFFTLLVALVVCLVAVSAGKVSYPARTRLPAGWEEAKAPLDPDFKLNLRIALYPKDPQTLERSLISIATPGSSRFREYLSKNDITAIVGRDEKEIAQVRDFFASQNMLLTSVHPHRDWIFIEATVQQVEKVFECKLATFFNKKMNSNRVAAVGSYSVPSEVSDIVKFVAGMTTFSFSHWQPIEALATAIDTYDKVTPQTIYDNYQVPHEGMHDTFCGCFVCLPFPPLSLSLF
jgi:subtilase family serine protease